MSQGLFYGRLRFWEVLFFYYVIDTIVPALICRALYPSDTLVVIFPFGSIYFIFFRFMVKASDRLVVFYRHAKFLSPTFEDKSLLTKEEVC